MIEVMREKWQKIIHMIPSWWFRKAKGNSIWVTAYRVYRIEKEKFVSGPRAIIDFDLVRVMVTYDKLIYADISKVYPKVIDDKRMQIDKSEGGIKETTKDIYLLLLTPFAIGGIEPNEAQVKERIRNSVAMLAIFVGRNIVYKKIFSTVIDLSTADVTAFSPVLENPLWFSKPDISKTRLKTILKAYGVINKLPSADRNRIYLSLRWFESAFYDSGVESFLKYWIALETLSMPDTTNIRPINEIISRAYSLPIEDVRQRFAIGRIYDLRCRIVHDGQVVSINGLLLKYIEELYVDLLIERLRLHCEFRAGSVMDEPEFSLDKFLCES